MNISELFVGNVSPQKWISGQIPGILTFFWSVVIALLIWGLGVNILPLHRLLDQTANQAGQLDSQSPDKQSDHHGPEES